MISIPAKLKHPAFNFTSPISSSTQLFNVRNPAFHVLRRLDSSMGAAARRAKNEKEKESAKVRREELTWRSRIKRRLHFWIIFTFIKTVVFFSFSLIDFFLCINVLKKSSSVQSFVWLPAASSEMIRRKALFQAQNQHSNSSHESSAENKLSAQKYYNQRFEKIDKNHRLITFYVDTINFHIDRIERLWKRSISFNVQFLMTLLTSSFFFRYCEVVDIDFYYTLKKSMKGRIKNFFHWLCNNYFVKKINSIETYWHQLSQLYIKWKERRINSLILKQIFDVNDKKTSIFRLDWQKNNSSMIRSSKNTIWTTTKSINFFWTRKTSWKFCVVIEWWTQTPFFMNDNEFNLRRFCWSLHSLNLDSKFFSKSFIEIWICSFNPIKSLRK